MNKCPKIGSRVSYPGRPGLGACVGIVTAIYKTYIWDDELEREGPLRPEREWHVGMRPDVLPDPWGYVGVDTFAPQVAKLTKAR